MSATSLPAQPIPQPNPPAQPPHLFHPSQPSRPSKTSQSSQLSRPSHLFQPSQLPLITYTHTTHMSHIHPPHEFANSSWLSQEGGKQGMLPNKKLSLEGTAHLSAPAKQAGANEESGVLGVSPPLEIPSLPPLSLHHPLIVQVSTLQTPQLPSAPAPPLSPISPSPPPPHPPPGVDGHTARQSGDSEGLARTVTRSPSNTRRVGLALLAAAGERGSWSQTISSPRSKPCSHQFIPPFSPLPSHHPCLTSPFPAPPHPNPPPALPDLSLFFSPSTHPPACLPFSPPYTPDTPLL